MAVSFPSVEFFEALRTRMRDEAARFERLGYFDTTFGVRVLMPEGGKHEYLLAFDVFDCTDVRATDDLTRENVDFTLEAPLEVWREVIENIRANGGADAEHGINTLTHFGERMRAVYDDPDGHDKMFRFAESIQAFFDLAADLDVAFAGDRRAGETAHA